MKLGTGSIIFISLAALSAVATAQPGDVLTQYLAANPMAVARPVIPSAAWSSYQDSIVKGVKTVTGGCQYPDIGRVTLPTGMSMSVIELAHDVTACTRVQRTGYLALPHTADSTPFSVSPTMMAQRNNASGPAAHTNGLQSPVSLPSNPNTYGYLRCGTHETVLTDGNNPVVMSTVRQTTGFSGILIADKIDYFRSVGLPGPYDSRAMCAFNTTAVATGGDDVTAGPFWSKTSSTVNNSSYLVSTDPTTTAPCSSCHTSDPTTSAPNAICYNALADGDARVDINPNLQTVGVPSQPVSASGTTVYTPPVVYMACAGAYATSTGHHIQTLGADLVARGSVALVSPPGEEQSCAALAYVEEYVTDRCDLAGTTKYPVDPAGP